MLHNYVIIFIIKTQNKILRSLREILLKFSSNNEKIFKTNRFGFKIMLDLSKAVDKRLYLNSFEFANLLFYQSILERNMIIFDVGANIGIYSLIASKKIGENGKVFSFEPSAWAYERINKNLNLNSCRNVEVFKVGVSNHSDIVSFYKCDDDAFNSILNKQMRKCIEEIKIDVLTIDDFCNKKQIKKLNVLKIDVEGADYLVLKGADNVISNFHPIILCEYNKFLETIKDDINEMITFLNSKEYNVYEINNYKLIEFDPNKSHASEIICLTKEHVDKYKEKKLIFTIK